MGSNPYTTQFTQHLHNTHTWSGTHVSVLCKLCCVNIISLYIYMYMHTYIYTVTEPHEDRGTCLPNPSWTSPNTKSKLHG
jgi:hypothetical protein